MTADGYGWATALRQRLGPGRLLPLGGPRDGAWIVEGAVAPLLRDAAASVRGVWLGHLRIGAAGADTPGAGAPGEPVVPAPPSALWPQPLRIQAEFAVRTGPTGRMTEPLPATAARLRSVLADAARALGLAITEVDLRVTALLEPGSPGPTEEATGTDEAGKAPVARVAAAAPEAPAASREKSGGSEQAREAAGAPDTTDGGRGWAGDDEGARVAAAVLAVPGVTGLAGMPGGPGPAVRVEPGAALPRRHVRVEIAVSSRTRPVEVALAVREAAGAALPEHPTVAVVVTAVAAGPTVDPAGSTGSTGSA